MKQLLTAIFFALLMLFGSTAIAQEPAAAEPELEVAAAAAPASEAVDDAAESVDPTPAEPDVVPVADIPEVELPGELEDAKEALALMTTLIQAGKEGKWGLVAAGVLMLLTFVIRRFFWKSIPKEYLPWLTVLLGAVVGFSTAMAAGTGLLESLLVALGGLFAGLAGIGAWEALGKKLLKPRAVP